MKKPKPRTWKRWALVHRSGELILLDRGPLVFVEAVARADEYVTRVTITEDKKGKK